MNCINSSMNSYDNNYKLHWNLILFDLRRLLLPSLRRSSANHLFSFFAKMKIKIKIKKKVKALHYPHIHSLPSNRIFQGQRHFLRWGNHQTPCASSSGYRHQHQERVQRWSPSGMPAMRGHRPILFPRCSPVYILVQLQCTVHEGALSSWLLIKR